VAVISPNECKVDSPPERRDNRRLFEKVLMKRSQVARKTANLSDSVQKRLNTYALAASAAGVLAVAPLAGAKIVYTPAHRHLPLNKTSFLDLNHDGSNDFRFDFYARKTSSQMFDDHLNVEGVKPGNSIVWFHSNVHEGGTCALALPKGRTVGPKRPFMQGPLIMFNTYANTSFRTTYCTWQHVRKGQAYLGLKFSIRGKTHYGWARFANVFGGPNPAAELTGYAYETIPNKPIITGKTNAPDDSNVEEPNASLSAPTPQPATIGMLALGSPALSIWRRKEPVGANAESN
jgi:hypothetical protein